MDVSVDYVQVAGQPQKQDSNAQILTPKPMFCIFCPGTLPFTDTDFLKDSLTVIKHMCTYTHACQLKENFLTFHLGSSTPVCPFITSLILAPKRKGFSTLFTAVITSVHNTVPG